METKQLEIAITTPLHLTKRDASDYPIIRRISMCTSDLIRYGGTVRIFLEPRNVPACRILLGVLSAQMLWLFLNSIIYEDCTISLEAVGMNLVGFTSINRHIMTPLQTNAIVAVVNGNAPQGGGRGGNLAVQRQINTRLDLDCTAVCGAELNFQGNEILHMTAGYMRHEQVATTPAGETVVINLILRQAGMTTTREMIAFSRDSPCYCPLDSFYDPGEVTIALAARAENYTVYLIMEALS